MQLKTEIIEEIGEKVAKKIFEYEKERNWKVSFTYQCF
jgi:hypothetical protein